jgi:hypothetical protein
MLSLPGCGDAGLRRVGVYGTVRRVGGAPVARGGINFRPDKQHRGPAASADIIDGAYHFDSKNGPTAGHYQVVITTWDAQTKEPGARDETAGMRAEWTRDVTVPLVEAFQYDIMLED